VGLGGNQLSAFAQYHTHKSIILHTRIREKINKYIKNKILKQQGR